MLQQLHISNYALIQKLDISFDEGFSVITGETGAGKSILLGALGFALGDRADTNVLYDKDEKCVVEAAFRLSDERLRPLFEENDLDFEQECTFRRELNPAKKTRAFINDTPVTLQTMKEIGAQLVDIHSQHDSLLLTDSIFQLRLLDEIAQNGDNLSEYKSEYNNWNHLKRHLDELKEMTEKNAAENDYLKFQFEELDKAKLKEGEYAEIEQTLQVMENAEEIKSLLVGANTLLENSDFAILQQINDLQSTLSRLKQLVASTEGMDERIENIKVELKDIAYDLDRLEGETLFDAESLVTLQERFDLFNRLMMKHRVGSFEELIGLRDELKAKISTYENIDEEIKKAQRLCQESERRLQQYAKKLHDKRCQAAKGFGDNVTTLARQLAMPFAVFCIEVKQQEAFTPNGFDHITFLFSANKGMEVSEMSRIASGGELSRLMLSIKSVVSGYNYIPTLIFDEIDTGVSGEVAAKIGNIMAQMGQSLQLLSITHLPQVASKAKHHYFIFKDNDGAKTKSNIKVLDQEERVKEIAKMLSNDKITPEAMKAAEVLLG